MKRDMVRLRWFFSLILATSLSAWGEDFVPNDFAFGYNLEFSPGKSVYEVPLPAKVYESVTKSDLGDLRVFNSDSEVVPHEIVLSLPKTQEQEIKPPKELRFFPLYMNGNQDVNVSKMKIETNDSGAIVEVRSSKPGEQSLQEKTVSGYLIDASIIESPIDKLIVEVEKGNKDQFFKQVNIHGSDDLKAWAQVATRAILANLIHQGETLKKNLIQMPGSREKF